MVSETAILSFEQRIQLTIGGATFEIARLGAELDRALARTPTEAQLAAAFVAAVPKATPTQIEAFLASFRTSAPTATP